MCFPFYRLHRTFLSKLLETDAEKILCLARQEGKLTLPLDGLTPGNIFLSADLVNAGFSLGF